MRVRSKAFLAAVAVLAIASGACSKMSNLQARKAFKEANGMYQAQNWKEAADKYQAVLAADPNFITSDGVTPYFFIANSYDNLYKPARKGEPENDAFLTKAIENLRELLEGAGASLGHVAKTTVFLVDMGDFPVMNEVYAEALGGHRPAWRRPKACTRRPRK